MGVGSENHRAVIGDGDGVLVVRGGQVVVGRDDPTIGARAHMIGSHRDHRLDGDDHTGLETNAPPLLSVIRNVGILVHHMTNTVPHIIAKHAIAVRLGEGLDGITNVPNMVTGNSLLDCSLKAIARDLAQGLGLGRRGTDEKRPSVIADPTVDNGTRIDGDDIAITQDHVGIGNTMHHGVVNRRTDCLLYTSDAADEL